MSSIFQEIDDALQQERLQEFWRQWRWPLLTAVAVALLALVGRLAWQDYQTQRYSHDSQALWAAQASQDRAQLRRLATAAGPVVRNQARWALAQDPSTPAAEAQQLWQDIIADWRAPELLQMSARLQLGQALLNTSPATAAAALQTVVDQQASLAPLAAELLAIQAENAGQLTAAQTHYAKALTLNPTAEQRVRVQARLDALQQGR